MSNIRRKSNNVANLTFAAIDPYIDTNIVLPTEKHVPGRNMVEWGDGNRYPDYLLDLYRNVPTLKSIISGNVDFVSGDDVNILPLLEGLAANEVNKLHQTIREQVRDLARDFETYGGFALQILRNYLGEVAEIYYIDIRFLRMNKECDVFYYCENWDKAGKKECLVYPAFMPNLDWQTLTDEERERHASSILYVKNVHTQVYPEPIYSAAVKSCETERCIDDYHLNAINNGFVSSLIVNFNNGIPEDTIKEEIEESFNEKFSGHQNAGRIMFSWNKSKDTATDIVEPKIEDFGDRYKALSDRSRQQIFTAFRANPNLFGIPTEGKGFSNEEYEESFRLYNRTHIKPIQDTIREAYDKIFGREGVITITPFTL